MYALNPNVVPRFEPQFHSTYAAFDSKRVGTSFYRRGEFEVLDYLARAPSELDEICRSLKADRARTKDFLDSAIKPGFVVDHRKGEPFSPIHVPP